MTITANQNGLTIESDDHYMFVTSASGFLLSSRDERLLVISQGEEIAHKEVDSVNGVKVKDAKEAIKMIANAVSKKY